MKKVSTYLLLFLPFYLIAQDDYCPCMDKQNEVDEWEQFILELDENIEQEKQVETQLIFVIPAQKTEKDRMSLPPNIDENVEVAKETTAIHTQQKQIVKAKKTTIKKRKKRFRSKLKSRTKVKKYRGQCPVF